MHRHNLGGPVPGFAACCALGVGWVVWCRCDLERWHPVHGIGDGVLIRTCRHRRVPCVTALVVWPCPWLKGRVDGGIARLRLLLSVESRLGTFSNLALCPGWKRIAQSWVEVWGHAGPEATTRSEWWLLGPIRFCRLAARCVFAIAHTHFPLGSETVPVPHGRRAGGPPRWVRLVHGGCVADWFGCVQRVCAHGPMVTRLPQSSKES